MIESVSLLIVYEDEQPGWCDVLECSACKRGFSEADGTVTSRQRQTTRVKAALSVKKPLTVIDVNLAASVFVVEAI